MSRALFRAAVHLFLVREGKVFLLRRHNTGWEDGKLTCVAGHLESGELHKTACSREALEEAGVVVKEDDIKYIGYQFDKGGQYFNFFFWASDFEGEPFNAEPDKCDLVGWYPLYKVPVSDMLPFVADALIQSDPMFGYRHLFKQHEFATETI